MAYLSVIVPTRSSSHTIQQCLQSIRGSLFKDYELLVVDSASSDATVEYAKKCADKVIVVGSGVGKNGARQAGIEASTGEIVVNIDSDVIVRADTLTQISDYFLQHKEVDAITGALSKDHPNLDFYSQYKNLYMNFIFLRLPQSVQFLYGSLYAMRRRQQALSDQDLAYGEDTALGQRIAAEHKTIHLVKEIEVIHLKKYTFFSLLKNDFLIPYSWAELFVRYNGMKSFLKGDGGFAHARWGQLLSVALMPCMLCLGFVSLRHMPLLPILFFLMGIWCLLNARFLVFLCRERGAGFGLRAFFLLIIDCFIMACGIVAGFVVAGIRRIRHYRKHL